MTGFAIVSTTVGSDDEARALGRALVEARLAACVQILPITSIYAWDRKIEEAPEHLLLCKVSESDFNAVESAIRERHSYDVPEIIMAPIKGGHVPYLDWMAEILMATNQSGGTVKAPPLKSKLANQPKPKLS